MVRLTKAVVNSTSLPVTVKTRLGWDEQSINIEEVAERLQDVGISALTIHARTRSQDVQRALGLELYCQSEGQPAYAHSYFWQW